MSKRGPMGRREFLSTASMVAGIWAGSGLAGALGLGRLASIGLSASPFRRKRILFIELVGAADFTMCCFPAKPEISGYDPANSTKIGPFSVPPVSHWPAADQELYGQSIKRFFEHFQNELLQIDGIRTSLAVHDFALRELATGNANRFDLPHFMALAAAVAGQSGSAASLGIVSSNVNLRADELVSVTPIPSAASLQSILSPNELNKVPLLRADLYALTLAEHQRRLTNEAAQSQSPVSNSFAAAWQQSGSLSGVYDEYKRYLSLGMSHDMAVGLACLRTGASDHVNIRYHGFDTHGLHFQNHPGALGGAFSDLYSGLKQARDEGFFRDTTIIIASEFGRTPFYGSRENPKPLNDEAGKDHHWDASILLMGNGIQGGRRVGSMDEWLVSQPMDLQTLLPSDKGEILTVRHLHRAIHEFFGMNPSVTEKHDLQQYKIPGIFTAAADPAQSIGG